eukprot:CAMPEP_0195536940 /NCGR_PEP_ID=MMETSP0794_2-20130614/46978_1 /TAXON_ID=515487 /ORGANISM="Stephanopyxis turris, Strain CCMP 815" /LENGTH=808 /DNA_ID=CAMNT_0040670507 /DNA_START=406 /DNA_END=2832 /DNA_ORIENTATION=+
MMGKVTARIMPKDFVEYTQRKPDSCIDTKDLLRLYRANNQSKTVPILASQYEFACRLLVPLQSSDPSMRQDEDEWIVNIDASIDYLGDCDEEDINPKKRSISTNASWPHHTGAKASLHHFEVHMNRKALEPANRTLRRLEISTTRKYQSEQAGHGKRSRKEWFDGNENKKHQSSSTTNSAVLAPTRIFEDDSNGDDSEVSLNGYKSFNLFNLTSAELFEAVASRVEADPKTRSSAILHLCMPDGSPVPLQIEACPPTILSVKTFESFESHLFVGVPLIVQTEVIHTTRSVVAWFANGLQVCFDSPCYIPTEADIGKYLSVLIVPVRPGHNGEGHEEAYRFKLPVEPLPFMPLVSPLRDEWTAERSKESLKHDVRFITYNLLADLYTSREFDQQMMYKHCPPIYLHRSRRMPMLLFEILSYHADVVCLQEVDASIYQSLLEPVMESQGYQGYYSNKASSQLEGCAMFWSLKCFETAQENDMMTFIVRDLFGNDGDSGGDLVQPARRSSHPKSTRYTKWDSMDSIGHLLDEHDELRRVTREKTGQVLQVASLALRHCEEDNVDLSSSVPLKPVKVVVGNSHLFYHPMADHVRAMQAYVVCKQIDAVRRNGSNFHNHEPYPLVLCGDLNSNPMSGALHLLLQRRLGPDHFETWKHLHDYSWEMGYYEFMLEHGYVGNEGGVEPQYLEEQFENAIEYLDEGNDKTSDNNQQDGTTNIISPPPLVLPQSFPNLISGYRDMPKFTNYAIDFAETLDYVLASEPSEREPFGFRPKRWAPMPSEEEVTRYVAMPNEFMPSDHVSLVCDLEWTHYTN